MAESVTVGELLVRIRADVNQLEAGLRTAGTGLTKFGATTSVVTGSTRRLDNALRGIGVAAAGLPGPIGRVMNQLLNFAPGGVIGAAVIGGLGAIALMWVKVREEAKKAAEEQQKTFNLLRNARIERIQGLITGPEITQTQHLIAELERLQALTLKIAVDVPGFGKRVFDTGLFASETQGQITAITDELARLWKEERHVLAEQLEMTRITQDWAFRSREAIAQVEQAWEKFRLRVFGQPSPQVVPILGETTRHQLPGGLQPGKPIPTVQGGQIGGLSKPFADRIEEMAKLSKTKFKDMTESFERSMAATIIAIGSMTASLIAAFQGRASFWQMLGQVAQAVGFIVGMGNPILGAGIAAGGTIISQIDQGRDRSRAPAPGAAIAGPDFSKFPAAGNPLAAARDRQWQTFLRESVAVSRTHGFRYA